MNKQDFRRKVKRELKKLVNETPEEHRERSLQIGKHLESYLLSFTQNASSTWILGGFAPMQEEPFWDVALGQSLRGHLAYPGDRGEGMQFFHCNPEELVVSQEFGVELLTPPLKAQQRSPDLLLVPGLAFTKKGERLGRGGGYFDRYLKNFNSTRIGVCFELQLREQLPCEGHDEKVDVVITEAGIYNRSSC